MYCAIPKTACQMQSWKRPVDCTTSEARTVSEASKPNENLIPEKVYCRVRRSPSEAALPAHLPVRSADPRRQPVWIDDGQPIRGLESVGKDNQYFLLTIQASDVAL